MRMTGGGLGVDLPTGWEGSISGGPRLDTQADEPAVWRTVAHFANFPLPAERADFGAETTEVMRAGDVFVVLFEYGPESADSALFAQQGVPRLAAGDFHRDTLQHGRPGQSGVQRFFQVGGRPFCLYVVAGSHIDRADAVPPVNALLDSLELR